jgi:hypothetical protein
MSLKPFRQSAIIKVITGRDGYGKPTTTSTTVSCRFIAEEGIKRTKEGDEIRYQAKVSLPNTVSPKPGDLINCQDTTLAAFYNRDIPILSYVRAVPDLVGGVKWWEVLL